MSPTAELADHAHPERLQRSYNRLLKKLRRLIRERDRQRVITREALHLLEGWAHPELLGCSQHEWRARTEAFIRRNRPEPTPITIEPEEEVCGG